MMIELRIFIYLISAHLLVLSVKAKGEIKILECLHEDDGLACAKKIADKSLDEIEYETTGEKNSGLTFSKIIEESGRFLTDGVHAILDAEPTDDSYEVDDSAGNREARKKGGKKKRKFLRRLIPLLMLFKAKISLLLQLIHTHLQFKFFAVAIISLIINIARFWLEVKRTHEPEKVYYYEHAQHQHHYEPEEEQHGYWKKRSLDNSPYSGWSAGQ